MKNKPTAASPEALGKPYDIYSRYRMTALIAPLLAEAVGSQPEAFSLAEIGGYPGEGALFLPDFPLRLYDVVRSAPEEVADRYEVFDIASGPLKQKADLVYALDVLEHIRPEKRRRAIANMAASAGSFLLLAGPYDGEKIVEVESMVRDFVKTKLGVEHRYLEEHAQHGLPDRTEVEGWMREEGFEIFAWPVAHLPHWGMMMIAHYLLDREPKNPALIERFNRYANLNYFQAGLKGPGYRYFLLGVRDCDESVRAALNDRLVPLLRAPETQPDWSGLGALLEGSRLAADDVQKHWVDHLQRELDASEEALAHSRAHVKKLLERKARIGFFLPFRPIRWILTSMMVPVMKLRMMLMSRMKK